jgi:hypothetical protein
MTYEEIIKYAHNKIDLVGVITEFRVEPYIKGSTQLIRYTGVVCCNNSYIQINGVITQYDDTYNTFIQQFDNQDPIGLKVRVIGSLHSNGVRCIYIQKIPNASSDYFKGDVKGIKVDGGVLYPTNYAHLILPLECDANDYSIVSITLKSNPLIVDDSGNIIECGVPSIVVDECCSEGYCDEDIVDRLLEEREIYLESLKQGI